MTARLLRNTLLALLLPAASYAQPCTQQVIASQSPAIICSNRSFTLQSTALTGATYSWTGPSGFTSQMKDTTIIKYSIATAPGDYIVTATVGACVYKDTVTIVVNPTPAPPLLFGDTAICLGDTLHLNAVISPAVGASFYWYGPNGYQYTGSTILPNGIRINPAVTDTGLYYTSVKIANGVCYSDTTSWHVKYITPIPAKPTLTSNSPLCEGNDITLHANTNLSNGIYYWTGPNGWADTNQDPIRHIAFMNYTGPYTVYAVVHGCVSPVATDSVIIMPLFPPKVTITVSPDSIIAPNASLSFTGTVTNPGIYPLTQWWVNKAIAATNTTSYSASSFNPGDKVCFWVRAKPTCGVPDTAIKCITMHPLVVGVKDLHGFNALDVYPNPSAGKFNINGALAEAANDISLEVLTTTGTMVYQQKCSVTNNKFNTTIDLHQAAAGTYLLRLNGTNAYTERHIIIR